MENKTFIPFRGILQVFFLLGVNQYNIVSSNKLHVNFTYPDVIFTYFNRLARKLYAFVFDFCILIRKFYAFIFCFYILTRRFYVLFA